MSHLSVDGMTGIGYIYNQKRKRSKNARESEKQKEKNFHKMFKVISKKRETQEAGHNACRDMCVKRICDK